MLLVFKRLLKVKIESKEISLTINNKFYIIVGLLFLIIATILMAVSSYINIPMYLISFSCAIALLFIVALLACGSVSAHNEGGYRCDAPRNELRMSDARFERLVELVKSESFDSGKLKIIEAASLGGFFSCRQAADLLKLFSFSSEKKNALRLIAPSIVGLYGIEQLIEQFSFTSDKEEALRILGVPVR